MVDGMGEVKKMDILVTALNWVVQGFSVIPIMFKDKKPESSLLPNFQWGVFQKRLPTTDELNWWFSSPRNIALVTGWNDLVVIDFDNQEVFDIWNALYSPKTFMVKTRRGVHVYLKIKEPCAPQHTEFIDIKSAGGYVLIPPSIHPSGYEYQIFQNEPIMQVNKLDEVLSDLFIPTKSVQKTMSAPQPEAAIDPWTRASNPITYTEDLIEKIRKQRTIEEFFPTAIKSGDHWMKTTCPFHNDKNPSFWIDTKRQICGCHVCNIKPMDVINLYSRLHSLDNRTAILSLAARL